MVARTRSEKLMLGGALLASCVAVGLGVRCLTLIARPQLPQELEARAPDLAALREEAAILHSEIEALRADAIRPSLEPAAARSAPAAAPLEFTSEEARMVQELARRIATVEAKLGKWVEEASSSARSGAASSSAPTDEEAARERRDRYVALFTDPMQPSEARLRALRELRRLRATSADRVIEVSLAWLAKETDPVVRARLLQDHASTGDERLVDPFLDRLRSDSDPRVRAEAAESLRQFRQDAGVKRNLEEAARSDVDPEVRSEATRALQESTKGDRDDDKPKR